MDIRDRDSPSGEIGPDWSGLQDGQEQRLPPDLDWIDELSQEEDEDDDGDLAVAVDGSKKRTYAETARMFKLRRNLDQLDRFHRQKEHDVLKAREKLKLCRENINSLLEQRDDLEGEIERQKGMGNSVAVFRLRSQHRVLCQKLQSEEELEGHISTELKQEELQLNEVEVELGRVSVLRKEVQEEEQLFHSVKVQKAEARLQQERKARENRKLKMKNMKDRQAATQKKEESERQRKIEMDRESRKIAAKFLKQTIKRMHQQDAEKQQQNNELVKKRTQAVEALKSSIAATQERLQAQQSRSKANTQKEEQQQKQLRESLQAQGINSISYMYQQKQLKELKRKQEEFEESQKSKRLEIVSKILQEEKLMQRNRPQLPKPPTTNTLLSLMRAREKLLHHLSPVSLLTTEETPTVLRDLSDISSSSSAASDTNDLKDFEGEEDKEGLEERIQQDEHHQSLTDSLAGSEFSGLWDQSCKKSLKEKIALVQTDVNQEEPAVVRGKLNSSAKKAEERKLKGPPFISKPDIVLFKDFEVGKLYKKKIALTNISYTINCCKFVRVSAMLKNFISINFELPGPLSTGMSCDVWVAFQPMINEDLEGEIYFASAVGPFSVSVRCTIKKCKPEVDSQFIDFGSHVVGKTISRTITLTNKGALGTLFSLDTSVGLSAETSRFQMPSRPSTSPCQETGGENTMANNQKSPESFDTREDKLKQQNQELSVTLQQEQSVSDAPEARQDAVPEARLSLDVDQATSDSDDIRLGKIRKGSIGPFESIKLKILFVPTVPGEAKLNFLITFSDATSNPIPVQARGVALSLPVCVLRPDIDLKICMFDRLYQDSIMVQSRASTALKLTFEVCPEMRKHMEILPKMGFIQAQSSFNAQLKFTPRRSLSKDACKFFDSDTGVLEVPMTVDVSGQVQPVHFTVHAVVTSSDLQFDQTEVDFGFCSIYQSVRSSVRLTNLSLLPQDFGFVGVPEFIDIQPNDGFGTLLPQETLKIDLIFSAKTAKEYQFQLSCKTEINRDFHLSCHAVGIHPPLALSYSLVQFGATAVGDRSTAVLHLICRQGAHNQDKQPVAPSVKNPGTAPAVPRLFSFAPPEGSDISICPTTGRLLPGERCLVQVMFTPRLSEQEITEEARRRLHRAKLLRESELERRREAEQEAKKQALPEPTKGKNASASPEKDKVSVESEQEKVSESADPEDIQPGSDLYEEARASLVFSFKQRYTEYTIPCFVSDGDPPADDRQAQPAWSPFNTLHLMLQCPAVQPSLVVTSNNGHNVVDFHQVAVGVSAIKRLTVQNISQESLDLRSSVLDINGPFSLLNALRCLKPGDEHTLVLSFSPAVDKKSHDILEVHSQRMTLDVTLLGEGVVTAVTSSHSGGVLDFGYVLEKEATSHVIKLQNSSVIAVGFRVLLQSLSPSHPQGGVDGVALLPDRHTDSQLQPAVGTQSYSGLSAFSAAPAGGSIAPGQNQDVTVTFQPDHPSVHFSDRLTIELMNKSKVCVMDVKGAASSHNMYLYGGDPPTVAMELLPQLSASELEAQKKSGIPLLVTLQASYSAGVLRPAVRELYVGCIRTTQARKEAGVFCWDNLASLQQQGFNVEPSKGTVEAGQEHAITITWTPDGGYKTPKVVQMCVPLTLKGHETNVYRVTLMASVSRTADSLPKCLDSGQ
ncbi:cilia- and flagella-associated protein 74 [Pholidichthys leucotaenia]